MRCKAAARSLASPVLEPEDGAWDPLVKHFCFITTDAFNTTKPGAVDPSARRKSRVEGRSRLWQLDFDDMSDPSQGGTLTMLLDGTEEHQMLDNMAVGQDGKILFQEDLGTTLYLAKVWEYNPNTDKLKLLRSTIGVCSGRMPARTPS